MSPRSLCVIPGMESFSSDLYRARWCKLACAECLQIIRSVVVGSCSIRS